jgi:hypothetical protein
MSFFAYVFNTLSAALFVLIGWAVFSTPAGDWSNGRIGLAFLAAIFCALIGNLERIESIKATISGIEAKTREAKAVVAEAKQAIDSLHRLAEMTGTMLIEMIAGEGRWGGTETDLKAEQRAHVLETLGAIGLPSDAIRRAAAADARWVKIDYSLGIMRRIRESDACSAELKSLEETLMKRWNGPEHFRPEPADFDRMLLEAPSEDPELRELLRDYHHYCDRSDHRRPDVWRNREAWLG